MFRASVERSRFLMTLQPVKNASLSIDKFVGKGVSSLIKIVPALLVSGILAFHSHVTFTVAERKAFCRSRNPRAASEVRLQLLRLVLCKSFPDSRKSLRSARGIRPPQLRQFLSLCPSTDHIHYL